MTEPVGQVTHKDDTGVSRWQNAQAFENTIVHDYKNGAILVDANGDRWEASINVTYRKLGQ